MLACLGSEVRRDPVVRLARGSGPVGAVDFRVDGVVVVADGEDPVVGVGEDGGERLGGALPRPVVVNETFNCDIFLAAAQLCTGCVAHRVMLFLLITNPKQSYSLEEGNTL